MISMSHAFRPPSSSVILGSPLSGLSANTFLGYVEQGEIRIFARYNWLYEPKWRKQPMARGGVE